MKISPASILHSAGSCVCRPALILLLLLLLLSFVPSADCRPQKTQSPTFPTSTTPSRNRHDCSSFPNEKSRSLCMELQRLHHRLRPSPPYVDPRNASEKRLVPSGPNRLHN